ncbi:uncharacterized protein EV420DRAFT_1761043 [Desarmillaria tabescens]|uniref:F-box domain-containing protein n=1 Tax=Armillaria tabescens TaxID=1929756 RepID=A0AA39TZE9_ARMTA|nr:uncharacterized protein EV420DRAFT_1761043 [Desarmillaria tabescens]KAK0463800.1 hypothetical protein EV420DRAFT_1761043 [Desarmillaria tabescens]
MSPRICLGCGCPNHYTPSTTLSDEQTDAGPTFDNLLRSNDPPSPSEECELRDNISIGEAHVAAIDDHVAALKKLRQALSSQLASIGAELEGLDGERGKAVARIAERKRILSPVRRLPPEILFKIFFSTIIFPMPRSLSRRVRHWWDFHPSESALWSVELVCKTWRHVVLDFPQLWSRINIFISGVNFSPENFRYVRKLARQKLARSRRFPDLCRSSFPRSCSPCKIEYNLSISFYLPHCSLLWQLYNFACLRKLTLLCTNGEEFRGLFRTELFGDTPLLNTLDTVDIGNVLILRLPYRQITHYSTYHVLCDRSPGPSTYYILPLLLEAEDLEACDLRCEEMLQIAKTADYSRSCSKLQTLTLSSWASQYPRSVLARLLSALALPRLSTLTVHCCVDEGHVRDTMETFTAVRGAVCRSQSPLTTFHFIHGNIDGEDLLALFRSASSTLQEVKLLDVGPLALTDDILTPLVTSYPGNVLLPRLHTLHISGEMKFDVNLFVKMVKSRWTYEGPSFQCLQTIELCRSLNIEDDREEEELGRTSALSKLEEYRAEGLKLSYNIL